MRILLIAILTTITAFSQMALAQVDVPKRELRGVWVATVNNIDFPKVPTTNGVAQKEQWKKMVERFKEMGLNAVFVQIRPTADAFYASEFVPWSKFLTGEQGTAPVPSYDPLAYMTKVAHDNGMDFHAWINPYRATMDLDTMSLSPWHVFYKHRDWLVEYGNKFYMNPGIPEVRKHIVSVVEEITANYDIDGIHMDDYFYPYPIQGKAFNDSLQYETYGELYGSLEDWRRNNNDQLIEALAVAIKQKKPYLKFGVSPFGVWRNKSTDPIGSETTAGAQSYDDLYADVVTWLENGWIDYVAPQIYFNIGYPPADYEILLKWWRRYAGTQKLVIGQAAYKVGANPVQAWQETDEIPDQIKMNRSYDDVKGSIFFSAKSLLNNPLGISDSLSGTYFVGNAITPFDTEGEIQPNTPKLKKVKGSAKGVKIKWKPNKPSITNGFGLLPPDYYLIYRWTGEQNIDTERATSILKVTKREKKLKKYFDTTTLDGEIYTYAVSAVNRFGNESKLSEAIIVKRVQGKIKKVK